MKTKIYLSTFLVVLVLLMSCEKDNNNNNNNGNNNGNNGDDFSIVFNPNVSYGSMTDQDGNVYKTVTIGSQTWMAENLRTTKYNDGSSIPNLTDASDWHYTTSGAYCNYNNSTDEDLIKIYGRLYNWHSINSGKLAPNGWRIPTDDDWLDLLEYLGGFDIGPSKLKEKGTTHWKSPNADATNESGFTALPGGSRDGYISNDIEFNNKGELGNWWTNTEHITNSSYSYCLSYQGGGISRSNYPKYFGFSVRCIKN